MRRRPALTLLAVSLALSLSAEFARAQYIPPFSQTFVYPTGVGTTASVSFDTVPYDTAVTFQPLAPPDNDFGVAPITTSLHFSARGVVGHGRGRAQDAALRGSNLHWQLGLALSSPLFRVHSYTTTLQGNCVFRLYGVPLGDTAIVLVRVVSRIAGRGPIGMGLTHGRVAISTNMGSTAHDFTHNWAGTLEPVAEQDTLEVPVRVLGDDPFLQFSLSLFDHVEGADPNNALGEVTADASFLDVPPGTSVVNAHGYGSVVLDAPASHGPAPRLAASARSDGRRVSVFGVTPGASGATLALYDLSGRRLADARIDAPPSGAAELTLPAALVSGIYFVRCADTLGLRSTRFAFVR